jgi:NTE family protein
MKVTATVTHPEGAGATIPTIALALGGGGARGLAHILMLEAFDELGLRPKIMSGTSIGAIFAAAYASGLSARDIRMHTERVLTAKFHLLKDVFSSRSRSNLPALRDLFTPRAAILSPESLLQMILPSGVARNFHELEIPLKIVATDFYGLQPHVFSEGPLRRAVAASMALPAIFEPVVINGRALIDGGLTNPLPFDLVAREADITVAIDVSGAPVPVDGRDHPTAMEALFASAFIFERTIIREKLKSEQPDIYIDAGTSHFQILDVFKVKEILAAAIPAKERLKRKLERILGSETVPELPAPLTLISEGPKVLSKPRLLKRLRPKLGRKKK